MVTTISLSLFPTQIIILKRSNFELLASYCKPIRFCIDLFLKLCYFAYRCINAVIAGNEYVRMEKENQLSNGHVDENLQSQMQSTLTTEASAKSTLLLFVKMSTGIILDCWNEANRSGRNTTLWLSPYFH